VWYLIPISNAGIDFDFYRVKLFNLKTRTMKRIMSMAAGLFITLSLFSQVNTSTVTIVLKGSQEWTVAIDGRTYTPYVSASNESTVVASDLQPGQHDLRIVRNSGSWYNRDIRTTFNLRSDFDKTLVVNSNGTVEQTENGRSYGAGSRAPMSSYDFQVLMVSIQNRRGYEKRNALRDAFENGGHNFTAAQTRQLLQQISSESQRLELAKLSYASVTDQWNFDAQITPLFRSTANRNELRAYTTSYSPNDYNNGSGSYSAMSDASFNNLYVNIQGQYNQSTRYYLASNAFSSSNNYFTSNQAARIITLLNDERNRLELAKLAYSRVVDQNNFARVYDLLYSRSSRDELTSYINSNGNIRDNNYNDNGYPSRIAVSEYEFNSIYRDISYRFGIGVKMSALTDLFTRNDQYFTVAQAEKLIRLVSDEDNRLQLAKLSLDQLVDPQNVSDMNDMFSRQSSRDELRRFNRR